MPPSEDVTQQIERIKKTVRLEAIIAEREPLTPAGHERHGLRHDSLKVNVNDQLYVWYSQVLKGKPHQGDVFSWLMTECGMTFREAVEHCARKANLPPPDWGQGASDQHPRLAASRQREDALTVAMMVYRARLQADPAALAYAKARGWTDETIQGGPRPSVYGLGYSGHGSPKEREELIAAFKQAGIDPTSPAAVAIIGFTGDVAAWVKTHNVTGEMAWLEANHINGLPSGMLVYPFVERSRVVYLAGRSIEGKRHHNLPVSLAGERPLMYGQHYRRDSRRAIIVEGPADVRTLDQWGLPVIGLAGNKFKRDDLKQIAATLNEQHLALYVALDNERGKPSDQERREPLLAPVALAAVTDSDVANALTAAEALGPLTRLVWWPSKDANDWLQAEAPTAITVNALFDEAETYVEYFCRAAGQASTANLVAARLEAFKIIAELPEGYLNAYKPSLAKSLFGKSDLRTFNAMLKNALREAGKSEVGEEPMEVYEIVGGHIGEHLIELLYDPEKNETRFAVRYPDGRIGDTHALTIDGARYMPMWPSTLFAEGVVSFPNMLGAEMPLPDLHARVSAFIHHYLDVEPFYESMAAYYVILSWFYDCFENIPYLRALGDYGTGKTRFIQTIGMLCYRPMVTSGATTSSPIFRLINKFKGSLILDEADFDKSDAAADIIKILNSGYMKGIPVLRSGTEKNNFDPEAFSVYGPKVIATRKQFSDKATESRCLTREMGGPTTRAIPYQLPKSFWEEAREVRNLLLTYRLKNWRGPVEIDETLAVPGVQPRLNQVVLPLLMLVDPGLRPDIYDFVRRYARKEIGARALQPESKVLRALVELHDERGNARIYLTDIMNRANQLIDEENNEGEDDDERGGKRMKQKGVGYYVRELLQLPTEIETTGPRKNHTYLIWDDERVTALKYRYGLAELPNGLAGATASVPTPQPVATTQTSLIPPHPEMPDWPEDWATPPGDLEFDR